MVGLSQRYSLKVTLDIPPLVWTIRLFFIYPQVVLYSNFLCAHSDFNTCIMVKKWVVLVVFHLCNLQRLLLVWSTGQKIKTAKGESYVWALYLWFAFLVSRRAFFSGVNLVSFSACHFGIDTSCSYPKAHDPMVLFEVFSPVWLDLNSCCNKKRKGLVLQATQTFMKLKTCVW